MPVYKLTAEVTVSAYTEVEAENEDEARKIAEERQAHIHGYGYRCDEYWIVEEVDGEPCIVEVNQ